jgi:hypothetical protein
MLCSNWSLRVLRKISVTRYHKPSAQDAHLRASRKTRRLCDDRGHDLVDDAGIRQLPPGGRVGGAGQASSTSRPTIIDAVAPLYAGEF